jgi:PAS domain S-box-containing protein
MTELTGYTLEEINRLGWYQTLYPEPEVRARVIERMARMRVGDDLRQEEWTIRRKDGTERVLAMSTSRVEAAGTEAVVALMTDVTDRKRAEEELRRSEARLSMAQQVAGLGSWEWDLGTGAVWWSAELYRLFGLDPSVFRPSLDRYLALVHPDDRPQARDCLERTLRDGAPYQYEYRIMRADGSIRWKRAHGVLERGPGGAPARLWGTAQDVTDEREAAAARRALEENLREARQLEALGALAGGIAHEFNNLLTTILGHAELALADLPTRSPIRGHLRPIQEGALRAAELCRQMLACAGKGRRFVGPVNLEEVVREAAATVTPAVSVDWDLRLPTRTVALGDADQLRQMAANLLTNAAEVTPKDDVVRVAIGRVTLDADHAARLRPSPDVLAGEYVLFEVCDPGPGMDEATLARAFEPFFSTKFPGRGLGLPVVLGVVRAHGGGLEVDTRPGHGTIVRVYLPIG